MKIEYNFLNYNFNLNNNLQHHLPSCKSCKCQNQSDEIAFALLMNFNKVFETLKMLFTIAKCFKNFFKIKRAAYEYIAAGCLFHCIVRIDLVAEM